MMFIEELHAKVLMKSGLSRSQIRPFFNFTSDNEFTSEDLFNTPANMRGELAPDHSARFLREIKLEISKAEHYIDIIALDLPDMEEGGFWEKAMFPGIKIALDNPNRLKPLRIRILAGRALTAQTPTTEFVAKIINSGLSDKHKKLLEIYVGAHHHAPRSWNHGKFIAVDSRVLITGGHNFLPLYLKKRPVYDLSIRLKGSAANDAHVFANGLWAFIRKHRSDKTWGTALVRGVMKDHSLEAIAPKSIDVPPQTAGSGKLGVLTIAQPGLGVYPSLGDRLYPFSRIAMYEAIDSATKTIDISQQDLGAKIGINASKEFDVWDNKKERLRYIKIGSDEGRVFDDRLMKKLANALHKNVSIRLVLSNPDAPLGYSNEVPARSIFRALAYFLRRDHFFMDGDEKYSKEQACEKLNANLQLRYVGHSGSNHWPNDRGGHESIGNHAKFWSIDHRLFYVGSHNMYPSTRGEVPARIFGELTEWGVIIDDGDAAALMIQDNRYFNDLFYTAIRVVAALEHMP